MNSWFWKESRGEHANKESVKSCNRDEEWVCIKGREGVPIVRKRERRDIQVY